MTRLRPNETVIARRRTRPMAALRNLGLGLGVGGLFYIGGMELLTGEVTAREMILFFALFLILAAALQSVLLYLRRFCLTDQRLMIGRRVEIPLHDVERVEVGPTSVRLRCVTGEEHQIHHLEMPKKLAIQINRCRSGSDHLTGEVAI
ncbi:hypothetical protein ACRARG_06855 [Pseudooceanicola sp. C21-150M6]|uniref:hypothetical protein n=1 Tax=Pseudooceanicola sp. C21-150M6 TaxID=3434355 RepID=UPI003D7F3D50